MLSANNLQELTIFSTPVFLILICHTFIQTGIPLFYLELAVGQRMRKAAISCWNLVSPFAAGIGIAGASASFVIGLYYNTMVAWTILYLWGSVTRKPLPFTVCPAESGSRLRNNSSGGSISDSSINSNSSPVFSPNSLSDDASNETECQVSNVKI